MMPADDLTPGQAAELLQVDSSTLRRWARAWSVHLSPPGEGKRRRYTPADLAVFARGRDMLRAGKSPAEVGALLALVPETAVELPALGLVSLPAVTQELQVHRDLLQALAEEIKRAREAEAATRDMLDSNRALLQENREVIEALRQKIVALEQQRDNQPAQPKVSDLEALKANQARQATQLAHLKQELAAASVKKPMPWWRRLFPRS